MITLIALTAILIWIIFYIFFVYRENIKSKRVDELTLRIANLIEKSENINKTTENINKTTENKFATLFNILKKEIVKSEPIKFEQNDIGIIKNNSIKIKEIPAIVDLSYSCTISTYLDPIKNKMKNKISDAELIYAKTTARSSEYSDPDVKILYEKKKSPSRYDDRVFYFQTINDNFLNIRRNTKKLEKEIIFLKKD